MEGLPTVALVPFEPLVLWTDPCITTDTDLNTDENSEIKVPHKIEVRHILSLLHYTLSLLLTLHPLSLLNITLPSLYFLNYNLPLYWHYTLLLYWALPFTNTTLSLITSGCRLSCFQAQTPSEGRSSISFWLYDGYERVRGGRMHSRRWHGPRYEVCGVV